MASSPEPAPRGVPAPSFAPTLRLALSLKGQAIQQYAFEDRGEITVGRDPSCDVWVDNPGVSRLHFRIARAETGEFRIVDQGSANGTWLNDQPVQIATLRDGDTVHFAKYSLEVRVDPLVGGRSTMRTAAERGADGATVMLSASEVRHLVGEAGGARPAAPARVVEFPAAATASGRAAGSRARVLWVVVGVAVAAAAAAWLVAR